MYVECVDMYQKHPSGLCLLLDRGLLEFIRDVGHGILLLSQLSFRRGSAILLGGLLGGVSGPAAGLGDVGLLLFQAGNLLLGLVDVLRAN
jgi:hypothetical protein